MKSLALMLALAVGATTLAVVPSEAEARRFGGGAGAGFQRKMPTRAATPPPAKPAQAPGAQQAPTQAAQGGAAGAGAAAQAGRRSWMGPIAGLAAGLGLAALFSHLGMGAGLANFMTLLLVVVAGIWVVRLVMRRLRGANGASGPSLAMAGAGAGSAASGRPDAGHGATTMARTGGWAGREETGPELLRDRRPGHTGLPDAVAADRAASAPTVAAPASALDPAPADDRAAAALPEGVDPDAFLRIAKQVFIRLQAANDAGDEEDLRRFTTPELFGAVKADLLERGAKPQKTDVVQLDAAITDTAPEAGREVVSVRFQGLIRENPDAGAEPFDELWHLERRADGQWLIAGIQPLA